MPKPPLPDEVQELLRKPNPSVIVSVRPDGQPVSVPTWYLWEDGRVLVNMDNARKRVEYLRKDPRVSISILSEDDWYTHVSIQGHIVEWADDDDLTIIDRCSRALHRQALPDPGPRPGGRVDRGRPLARLGRGQGLRRPGQRGLIRSHLRVTVDHPIGTPSLVVRVAWVRGGGPPRGSPAPVRTRRDGGVSDPRPWAPTGPRR